MIKLFKHQEQSVKFCLNSDIVFDTSDPGTGKTGVHITWYAKRRNPKKLLVLAPKSLLVSAWANDIKKFAPRLSVSVATAANRKVAFAADFDVLVTNHDAVNDLLKQPAKWFKQFDAIVCDESTAFKHRDSGRSKALAKIIKYFKYRHFLTGTPNSNGVCDLWHQVYLLDDGKRLGKSFFGFRSACCEPEQTGPSANMVTWHDKPGIERQIEILLSDITIRHKFEECVDIPANHQYAVEYKLSAKHQKLYDELEATSLLVLNNSSITAINGAVLYTKLMQCASGASYDDNGGYTLLDSGRYELVMDLLEERDHSIVFFNWGHQREEMCKLADKRGYKFAVIDGRTPSHERDTIVKHYQAGFYKVLFAHPQSAGHGLTLTRGRTTIWASPTYNLEHFQQANRRIYRISQTQKTETIVLIAPGTVDERVYEALMNKNTRMEALLACLQESSCGG